MLYLSQGACRENYLNELSSQVNFHEKSFLPLNINGSTDALKEITSQTDEYLVSLSSRQTD